MTTLNLDPTEADVLGNALVAYLTEVQCDLKAMAENNEAASNTEDAGPPLRPISLTRIHELEAIEAVVKKLLEKLRQR